MSGPRRPALEALLRDRLDAAVEPGLKSTWFAALRNVATTPETIAWLRALWQREATVPGLPLVEADETALAYALAVRGLEGEQGVLDTQRGRITNPDRKARFEFVRGAATSDAGVRERWFRALEDPANRRREIWVLQEVHRAGALFFDAGWVDATLRGHSSPRAAAVVVRFIDSLPPDYPPRLRAQVLQGSDLLMRAARTQSP